MNERINLGKNIEAAIEAQGRPQADIARAAGISAQTLNVLIQRGSQRSKYLIDITHALQLTPDDLLRPREDVVRIAKSARGTRQPPAPEYRATRLGPGTEDFSVLLAVARRLETAQYQRLVDFALDLLEEEAAQPSEQ